MANWSWGVLCCATAGGALAFGALHAPTLVVVALMVFGSAALVMVRRGGRSIPGPTWLLFGLAAYSAIQAAPLPAGWVAALSPSSHEVWERAFEVAGGKGRWMSLSVDRGATLVEVLKWAMYGAAFMAAASYGARRSMARGLLLPLACAVLIALVTLAHGLVSATAIYGFYEPTVARSIWHMGPLLNPNHLASYLNFGIFCGLGLLVARRRLLPTWLLGLAVAFLIPNAIVAGSRGGIVGLVVGLGVFLLTLPRRRYADPDFGPVPKLALLASLSTVFLVAGGFTVILARAETARDLYQLNVDKLKLLAWSGRLIADYPWFGVGRGAFESVFSAYRSGNSNEIFTHPENLPAQWLGEWGVPVGAAALVAFVWMFRPRRLGARWSAIGSGAAAAVAAIVAQNLVDFGLEVPAVALLVIVAVGVCWGHAKARRADQVESASNGRPWVSISLGAVVVLLSILVLSTGTRPLVYERSGLSQAYQALADGNRAGLLELREATTAAVLAHPADPWFYRMGALVGWRAGEDPMPWLARALERGPAIGRTHLLVARVLASRRAIRQALLELRLAAIYDPNLVQTTAQVAVSWTQNHADLLRAVPDGEAGIRSLLTMARAIPEDALVRERLLLELIDRNPSRKESLAALGTFFMRELEHPESSERCAGDKIPGCIEQAERWIKALERIAPHEGDGLLLRSRLMRVTGASDQALALLGEQCPNLDSIARSRCFQKRLELASTQKDAGQFVAAAKQYVNDKCTDSEQCATAYEKVADLSANRGEWQTALAYYDRAAQERPEDRVWIKVARAGARVGAVGRVRSALDHIQGSLRHGEEYTRLLKAASGVQFAEPRKR